MDTNETIDLLKDLQIWMRTIDFSVFHSDRQTLAFFTPADIVLGEEILKRIDERIESDSNKIQELLDNFMVELEI